MAALPSRVALTRALRRHIEVVAQAAEAERQHDRTRKRARGDRSVSFWEDGDRFALALMAAIRMGHGAELLRFGSGRSDWAAARQAAALMAPGAGQRVAYVHRIESGLFRARPEFGTGDESHDAAARRLTRKRRSLDGTPTAWVELSASVIGILNSPTRGAARRHAWTMMNLLGWRHLPRGAFERLNQLLTPSKINTLRDLSTNDGARVVADDPGQPRLTAGHRLKGMKREPLPILNTLDATKKRLGCGRTKVRELANAGDLEAVKLGRRTLITEASLQGLVGRLPRVGTAPRRISK